MSKSNKQEKHDLEAKFPWDWRRRLWLQARKFFKQERLIKEESKTEIKSAMTNACKK